MDAASLISHQQQQPPDVGMLDSVSLNLPTTNHNNNQLDHRTDSSGANISENGFTGPSTTELSHAVNDVRFNGHPPKGVQPPLQNGSSSCTQAQTMKKSSIPRLLPSSIPRLQTQQSVPLVPDAPQCLMPTSPQSESHPDPSISSSVDSPTTNGRSRVISRPSLSGVARYGRSTSENPQRFADTESDTSSVLSGTSSGAPRRITSKINSLKNAHHKPGGGNVTIVDQKVKLGPITSKCNSLANVKHKPGGGNVQIVDSKLDTSSVASRVNSMQNVKHTPAGGQVQILSEKLAFDKKAQSKVGSLKNAHHHPGGGDVKIYNESLPWLKYNKPNLPPEEKARINKRHGGDMSSSVHSGSTALTSNSGGTR